MAIMNNNNKIVTVMVTDTTTIKAVTMGSLERSDLADRTMNLVPQAAMGHSTLMTQ